MSATGEQTIPLSISGYKEISEKQIPIRTVGTPGEQSIPLAISGYLEIPAQAVPITIDGYREIDFQFIPLRLADQSTLARGEWLAPLLKYLTQVGKVISVELAQGLVLTVDLSLSDKMTFGVFCYDVTEGGDLEDESSYYDAEDHLPPDADLEYRALVAWGDGSFTQITAPGNYEHTYARAGTYTVHIRGHLPHFTVAYTNWDAITAANWQRGLTTLVTYDTFWDVPNMTSFQAHPDALANVLCHEYTWEDCLGLTSFPPMNFTEARILHDCWDTCTALTEFPVITIPNATVLDRTWRNCDSLTSFPLLELPAAEELIDTWRNCTGLTSFPALSLPACTVLDATWQYCTALTSFPALDLSNVRSLPAAWKECESLTSFPALDLSNAVTFNETWEYCRGFTSFPALDLPAGRNFRQTWKGCSSLTNFPSITLAAHPGDFVGFEEAWRDCTSLSNFPPGMFDVFGADRATVSLPGYWAPNHRTSVAYSTTRFYNYGFRNTWTGCVLSADAILNVLESIARARLWAIPTWTSTPGLPDYNFTAYNIISIGAGSDVEYISVSDCVIWDDKGTPATSDDEIIFDNWRYDTNLPPRVLAVAGFIERLHCGAARILMTGDNVVPIFTNLGLSDLVDNTLSSIMVTIGDTCELSALSNTIFATSTWGEDAMPRYCYVEE